VPPGFANPTDAPNGVLETMHSDQSAINLRFPVMPNISYTVDLYFVGTSSGNTFDINIEGNTLISGYTAPTTTADQQTFTVAPTDGVLNIDLVKTSGSAALINGVKITPVNGSTVTSGTEEDVKPFALKYQPMY